MDIPWILDRCIICLKYGALSKEHIISEQIGGKLWSKILCKNCNDKIGHEIEADIKKDPSIRLAIEGIKHEAPSTYEKLSSGLEFIAISNHGRVKGKFKNNEFSPRTYQEQDGSIIQPTKNARKSIKRILEKQNLHDDEITEKLFIVDNAPLDKLIKLDKNIEIIKWDINEIHPNLTGEKISDIVLLKMAYEFLALHLGTYIYQDSLQPIRDFILNKTNNLNCYEVEYLRTTRYEAFHGMFIEQKQPCIWVQVRLFGWLVYRVKFPKLALDEKTERAVYHIDLKTNEEHVGRIP